MLFLLSTAPIVSSVEYPLDGSTGAPAGTPGTFVFRPGMANVGYYEYYFDGEGGVEQAEADGTLTVTYTPLTPGVHYLWVVSINKNGFWSDDSLLEFVVG